MRNACRSRCSALMKWPSAWHVSAAVSGRRQTPTAIAAARVDLPNKLGRPNSAYLALRPGASCVLAEKPRTQRTAVVDAIISQWGNGFESNYLYQISTPTIPYPFSSFEPRDVLSSLFTLGGGRVASSSTQQQLERYFLILHTLIASPHAHPTTRPTRSTCDVLTSLLPALPHRTLRPRPGPLRRR